MTGCTTLLFIWQVHWLMNHRQIVVKVAPVTGNPGLAASFTI